MRLISIVLICLILLTGCSYEQNNAIVVKAKGPISEDKLNKRDNAVPNSPPPDNPSEQTPTFTINEKVKGVLMLYEVRGEKGKFGFLDKPLIKGEDNQLEWIFWPADNQLLSGNLKIKGVNPATGQEVESKGKIIKKENLIKDFPRSYKPLPLSDKSSIDSPKNYEVNPASIASTSFFFLESGIWELKILVNEKIIGKMKVFVRNNEPGISYLKN
ncbi:hypothetical protein [Cytobacillus firmus]|uniref:Lipoprotein n=1 Tax=Cytobacillus firmus DS1 TaxID=1307436 RepID=W7L9C6_CYTFI|nr:hypothetical protein [Cytobacillus firmus]EWG08409.1 hypothetical protein PBF_24443 [Cytobacillus firmus DS1]